MKYRLELTSNSKLSTIESSVTRLLVATKHLLESLTQWAKGSASETDISDAYVQLGNEFKVACRAFTNAGVNVSDLGDVPHALRVVLEEALCETPSQESLDKYLPSIREIIVSLLQSLKTKQNLARAMKANKARDSLRSTPSGEPSARSSGVASLPPAVSVSQQSFQQEKQKFLHSPDSQQSQQQQQQQQQKQKQHQNQTKIEIPKHRSASAGDTSVGDTPTPSHRAVSDNVETASRHTNNALEQLQKGDSLQRRASRRFSAYQYAKLTSFSPGKDPELPDSSILERTKSNMRRSNLSTTSTPVSKIGNKSNSITVFLKIRDRVKKCELTAPITLTTLRLLFVEKFAYSPGSGQFPDILILDKDAGVSYELEESMFSSIEDGSVLSLNVSVNADIMETVNKNIEKLMEQFQEKQKEFFQSTRDYIDSSTTDILKKLEEMVENSVTIQQQQPQQQRPLQYEAGKEPLEKEIKNPSTTKDKNTANILSDMSDLLNIRHEISVIKQINNSNKMAFKASIDKVLQKVNDFKSLSLDSSKASTRTYMEESQQKLSKDSDELLTKFDDVQDLIEALRKDVAQRGAHPSEKQLDYVQKQLNEAQGDLDNMVEYIKTEKPNWKKIWESELDTVCQEQQFLTLQEDLTFDLKEDLAKATETYDLVRQCCIEQTKNPRTRTTTLPLAEPGSLPQIRDALLSEVEALKPNHDSRVEAIEKAEKLRAKERQLAMMNKFEEELGGFVEDSKLKKSGGIEEVDRVRRMKDEQNLRSNFPPPF